MKQKRCVELHIPHYNPQTHKTTGVWSLTELASLYTVPLSAVNGLSHLTKLTTSKGAGTTDSISKFSNWPIPFESNRTADSNLNRISKLCRSLLDLHVTCSNSSSSRFIFWLFWMLIYTSCWKSPTLVIAALKSLQSPSCDYWGVSEWH